MVFSGNPATSENRQSASWKLLRRCNSSQARGGSDGHAGSSASGGDGVLNGGEENRTDDDAADAAGKILAVGMYERALTCCSIRNVSCAALATDLDLSCCNCRTASIMALDSEGDGMRHREQAQKRHNDRHLHVLSLRPVTIIEAAQPCAEGLAKAATALTNATQPCSNCSHGT